MREVTAAGQKLLCLFFTFQLKAHQESEVRHLTFGHRVRRVRRQARIAQALDPCVARKPLCQDPGRAAHPRQPHLQRFQPPVQKPGLERPRHRARQLAPLCHPRHEHRIPARDMAVQHIRMARRRLGIGRHHQIGAKVQRTLQQRGHGGVVHNQLGANRMGLARGQRDVAAIETGVGGGLDEHRRRAGEIRAVHIAGGNQLHVDPKRGQKPVRQKPRRIVAILGQDQHVSGFQHGEQRRRDRRHAGGKAHHRCAFQYGQLLFHLFPGRHRGPAIGMARPLQPRQMEGCGRDHRRHNGVTLPQPGGAVVQHVGKAAIEGHGGLRRKKKLSICATVMSFKA